MAASVTGGVRLAVAADAHAIARVQVESWQATYPGVMPQTYLDSLDLSAFEARWSQGLTNPGRRVTHVVEQQAAGVTGFAVAGPVREPGQNPGFDVEVYAIYLLPQVKRRGLGRKLMAASVTAMTEQGARSVLVWVARDNLPARRFYEHLGGVYVRPRMLDFGAGFEVPEVGYGWADVRGSAMLAQ